MSQYTKATSGGGGTVINSGTLANIPVAGIADRYYWATDVRVLYRDTGTAWESVAYGDFYERVLGPLIMASWGGNQGSIANRAYGSPRPVPFRCRIDRLGFVCGGQANTGNFQIACYGPYPAWDMICTMTPVAVNTLTANIWNWFTPTTTPTIQPGLYWFAHVCDTNYSAGVAGMQFAMQAVGNTIRNCLDLEVEGYNMVERMDNAYPLPDPFVPVNHSVNNFMSPSARVTHV